MCSKNSLTKSDLNDSSNSRLGTKLTLKILFMISTMVLLTVGVLTNADNISTDAAALLDFLSNVTSYDKARFASWNGSATTTENASVVCNAWFGVTCNNTRVVELRLPGARLNGPVASSTLGRLSELRILSLRSNNLSGSFPSDVANCRSLATLNLSSNSFSGSFLPDLPSLASLDLSFNRFSGPIPPSISNLTSLAVLRLENNTFSGAVPELPRPPLKDLDLSNNDLEGSIPASYADLPAANFIGNAKLCGAPLPGQCSNGSGFTVTHPKTLSAGSIAGIVLAIVAFLFSSALCIIAAYVHRARFVRTKESRSNTHKHIIDGDVDAAGLVTPPTGLWPVAHADVPKDLVFFEHAPGKTTNFKLDQLLRASARILGKGSFGTMYKCTLEDGLVVVVHRFKGLVSNEREESVSKIEALGALKHRHLVPFIAYFFTKGANEQLVVVKYVPNDNLSTLLKGEGLMEWKERLNVAIAVAEALAYLHEHNVVHGSMSSSNVLIGEHGDVYVAEYGLMHIATLLPLAKSNIVPYLAPELVVNNYPDMPGFKYPKVVNPSADVYSFGILLLELITRKPPPKMMTLSVTDKIADFKDDSNNSRHALLLQSFEESRCEEQWIAEVFYSKAMESEHIKEEVAKELFQVALTCVVNNAHARPKMIDVVSQINALNTKYTIP